MSDRIKELAKLLRKASDAYYAGANAIMSDAEFDRKRDELENLDPSNPFLATVGAPAANSALTKCKHAIPMGSLRKITTDPELQTWLKSIVCGSSVAGTIEIAVQLKLDGLSIELLYDKGKFVQAITRGDGQVGEDVTHTIKNAKFFPRTISVKTPVSVRCECMLQLGDWKKHFSDTANPRNAASGLTRRSDAKGSEHLACIAFDVLFDGNGFKTEADRITWLCTEHFITTPNVIVKAFNLLAAIKDIEGQRDQLPYEIDGAVVKLNNIAMQDILGEHNGRPYWARAWKFAPMGGHTTLNNVTWSVGTRGTITPVANVAPVAVGGTTIRNVSLSNLNEIGRLGIGIGDTVEVVRAGDVIPKIVRVVARGKKHRRIWLDACPACGGAVERRKVWDDDLNKMVNDPFLYCKNSDKCSGVHNKQLKKYVKKRNILFLGDSNLDTLIGSGAVKTIPDFYNLTISSMMAVGVSGGMATKIYAQIQSSVPCPLAEMIGSMSLDMLGRSEAGNLVRHGIDSLDKWKSLTAKQIGSFPGYSKDGSKATRIAKAVQDNWSLIEELSKKLVISVVKARAPKVSGGPTFVICLTGTMSRPRQNISDDIVAAGHSVVSRVARDVTHLCQADPSSQSSKSRKASDLGIPVISEQQLVAMLK